MITYQNKHNALLERKTTDVTNPLLSLPWPLSIQGESGYLKLPIKMKTQDSGTPPKKLSLSYELESESVKTKRRGS